MNIRKATTEDIPRIAKILVFSKRKNYRYISNYHCRELWVLDENEKAKNFYLKHGFTETNQVKEVPEAPGSKITERKMILDCLVNH